MKKSLRKIGIIMPALLAGITLTACQSFIDNFNSYIGAKSSSSEDESSIEESTTSEVTSSGNSSSNIESSSSSNSSSSSPSKESSSKTSSSSSSIPTSSSSASSSSQKESSAEAYVPTKQKVKQNIDDFVDQNAYPISHCPTVGNAKLLVIPVWFSDSASQTGLTTTTRESVRNDIETAYFGTKEETGWHSVKSFYEYESGGKLNITGTVSDWYECGVSASTYGRDSGDSTMKLVNNAINWYFNNHSDNRKDYDCDSDGYLDGVMLIYGAPDYSTSGNNNYSNFWAYCYWLQDESAKNVNYPGGNVFFWASYDFMYGSTNKKGKYAGGSIAGGISLDTHTYIHEMGHVFGLDDYYDYSNSYIPSGGFSMQDYNVGGHDPYSAIELGWVEPYVPTDSCTINLKPYESSQEVILLTPNQWSTYASAYDEYILIEYYKPEGINKYDATYSYCGQYPTGSNVAGIRIWHVDARVLNCTKVGSDGYPSYSESSLTNNLYASTRYGFERGFSNTYYVYGDDSNSYCSPLGSSYSNYNTLQMIRNNTGATYKPTDFFTSSNIFKAGSTFSLSKFSKQFVKGTKMNCGKELGFTVNIKTIGAESATIEIVKN